MPSPRAPSRAMVRRSVTDRAHQEFVIAAAALVAIGLTAATPGVAQDRRSMQDLFNACVEQAKQAGWSQQDITNNRDAARRWVANCMRNGGASAKTSKKSRSG